MWIVLPCFPRRNGQITGPPCERRRGVRFGNIGIVGARRLSYPYGLVGKRRKLYHRTASPFAGRQPRQTSPQQLLARASGHGCRRLGRCAGRWIAARLARLRRFDVSKTAAMVWHRPPVYCFAPFAQDRSKPPKRPGRSRSTDLARRRARRRRGCTYHTSLTSGHRPGPSKAAGVDGGPLQRWHFPSWDGASTIHDFAPPNKLSGRGPPAVLPVALGRPTPWPRPPQARALQATFLKGHHKW